MKRILVTGGSSFLGHAFLTSIPNHIEAATTYWQNKPDEGLAWSLDVRDREAVMSLVTTWRPELIIHLAGSNRTADMMSVIVEGTTHLVMAAQAVGARFLFMSTDVVFDGQQGPYDETATLRPLHDYGRAKQAAEAVVAAYETAVIIRTSLIYDPSRWDQGTRWIAAALDADEPVTLFTNQLRNPIAAPTLAAACWELADLTTVGILNIAGDEVLTRADYSMRLLNWFDIPKRANITFGEADNSRWPLDTQLDIRRAQTLLETPLLGVTAVLEAAAKRR